MQLETLVAFLSLSAWERTSSRVSADARAVSSSAHASSSLLAWTPVGTSCLSDSPLTAMLKNTIQSKGERTPPWGEYLGDRVDVAVVVSRQGSHPELKGAVSQPTVNYSPEMAIRSHRLQTPHELGMRNIVKCPRRVE